MAFTTGFISIYSSTSGVVLPAFLPTVPGLAAQVGGVEPLAIASSMNVGAHLVDVSALSTLGALCMASAPKHEDSRKLFNKLMAWGLSMTVVGLDCSSPWWLKPRIGERRDARMAAGPSMSVFSQRPDGIPTLHGIRPSERLAEGTKASIIPVRTSTLGS